MNLSKKIKTAKKLYKNKGIEGIVRRLSFKLFKIPERPVYCREEKKRIKIYKKEWKKRVDFQISPLSFGCLKEKFDYQRKYQFSKNIKFSILVPLYNTPEIFLKEMIATVLFQTYENWELLLADGSDESHKYVENICKSIAVVDSRIKYKKLEKNGGISVNTNEALKMATGDYISLFDHDDLLNPCALFETMNAICNYDADVVYTDEMIFESPDLYKIKSKCFKPDFIQKKLEVSNYVCHFLSFKKLILPELFFDTECDGAQDYDVVLKLSENSKNIVHIPKCLYYWRASPTSTAGSSDAKPYTTLAGKLALDKHFQRLKRNVKVEITKDANVYKCVYEDGSYYNDDNFIEERFVFPY